MQPLAILVLSFALIAVSTAAEPKGQYGGFSSDTEGQQAYHDYIHSLEMIPVETGAELQQAIEAIPVEPSIALTSGQEANLRAWLYDFLVAFSVSGNDSLAAAFYLREREGVDNPDKIQRIKEQLESGPSDEEMAELNAKLKMLKEAGIEMSIPIPEPIPDAGDTPLDILKTQHRLNLDMKGCDYCFDKVSFFDSKYRVSEFQGAYGNYADHLKTHGLLPVSHKASYPLGIKEHEKALQGQWVAAQFMFIAEEPEECADFEKGPLRYPFFVRLVWSPEKTMWRLAEIVMPNDAPVQFSFL